VGEGGNLISVLITTNAFEASVARAATLRLDGELLGGRSGTAMGIAEKNGRAADLQKELEELFNSQNKSAEPNRTSIPATFLRVTVEC
jgi:hypothetical protein